MGTKAHEALALRELPENHAIHTAPLSRREQDYRLLDMPSRRSTSEGFPMVLVEALSQGCP
jgi:hypothetical protein